MEFADALQKCKKCKHAVAMSRIAIGGINPQAKADATVVCQIKIGRCAENDECDGDSKGNCAEVK